MVPIFIGWIGEAEGDPDLLAHAGRLVARAYRRPVSTWTALDRPRHAYDPRRRQHDSSAILRWLLDVGPRGGKVLAVTDRDLFIPILTYVFGEAQLGGAAAVVSTARLAEDADLFGPGVVRERLAKEAVHELGHTFGLRHCATPACVMGRSAGVRDVDEKDPELCDECLARLEEPEGA